MVKESDPDLGGVGSKILSFSACATLAPFWVVRSGVKIPLFGRASVELELASRAATAAAWRSRFAILLLLLVAVPATADETPAAIEAGDVCTMYT